MQVLIYKECLENSDVTCILCQTYNYTSIFYYCHCSKHSKPFNILYNLTAILYLKLNCHMPLRNAFTDCIFVVLALVTKS